VTTVRSEDRDGGVRVLTLDRPPANAINQELLRDLSAALDHAREDDAVRAVVVTGNGPFLSGGFDLHSERATGSGGLAEEQATGFRLYRESHLKLLAFPKPTIAMMSGHAIAGGLIIVLACDYRLGLDGDYRIGLNEVAIGAAFPRVAFETVRLRLTHQRASELLLGASVYPASEALRLGVVDEILPAEKLEDTVMRRAARLGAYPREAYAHTKAALIAEAVARVESETEEERMRTAAVWVMPESRAARDAQRRKLRPD
jgi:enoyl-CoA hydratase